MVCHGGFQSTPGILRHRSYPSTVEFGLSLLAAMASLVNSSNTSMVVSA
jgi:hypothetical protein